jgi:predicted ABC-type sugar transport system permease subunit
MTSGASSGVRQDTAAPPRRLGAFGVSARTQFAGVLALLIVLFLVFSFTEPRFFTTANIRVMLTGVAILWMIALGLTIVMLTGGFDLSLGSMLGLGGFIFVGFYVKLGLPALAAVILTVRSGCRSSSSRSGRSRSSRASRSWCRTDRRRR